MPRPSHLDEWWPYLLRMEKDIQQYGLSPHQAALKIVHEHGRRLPGHGDEWSKVKMLEHHHREHRDKLKDELGEVPRIVEWTIAVTSPQKVTLARRWFDRLGSLIKNTKTPAG